MKTLHTEFWMAVHNLITHPAMQLCTFVSWVPGCGGAVQVGDAIHDWSLPRQ